MKLTTIVLNWRTPDMTLDAVRAALRAMRDVVGGWNLYVVDNDSGDGSEAKIREGVARERELGTQGFDRVEVVQSGHNGGFGAGNNVGIRRALASSDPPEYLYILNSDAFPAEDAITALLKVMESSPEYGIAGSYIHGVDGEPHVTAFRFPTIQSEIEMGAKLGLLTRLLDRWVVPIGIPERSMDVDWLAGASMLMRARMLDEIGLFDETFFLYFEETDLCRRAADAGWKTRYVLESRVAHIGSVSTGMKKWNRIPGYWLDSRRHYFSKNHGRPYWMAATVARVLSSGLYEARRRVQGKPAVDPERFLPDLVRHTLLRR